jgi:hypothetical protein
MVERIFIVEAQEPGFDAASARRQFSLSLAVGFAVLAWAAVVEFQPAHSAPGPLPTPTPTHSHSQTVNYALAAPVIERN